MRCPILFSGYSLWIRVGGVLRDLTYVFTLERWCNVTRNGIDRVVLNEDEALFCRQLVMFFRFTGRRGITDVIRPRVGKVLKSLWTLQFRIIVGVIRTDQLHRVIRRALWRVARRQEEDSSVVVFRRVPRRRNIRMELRSFSFFRLTFFRGGL